MVVNVQTLASFAFEINWTVSMDRAVLSERYALAYSIDEANVKTD